MLLFLNVFNSISPNFNQTQNNNNSLHLTTREQFYDFFVLQIMVFKVVSTINCRTFTKTAGKFHVCSVRGWNNKNPVFYLEKDRYNIFFVEHEKKIGTYTRMWNIQACRALFFP